MSADAEMQRHQITFGQAEGKEPLPAQLKLGEISPELTAYLWRVIHESLAASTNHSSMGGEPWLAEEWKKILYDWHTIREHKFADEFDNKARTLIGRVKIIVTSGDYLKVLNFVEFVARHRYCPRRLLSEMTAALELSRSAYRLIDKSIIPIVSEEESRAIVLAFADVQDEKYRGARQHLREAGSSLSIGNFADSIRHSVHAVESVARTLSPTSNTIGPALAFLEKKSSIHPAMKLGFEKLYAFSSDENGIRHALLDETAAKVDEIDALYMFGACASFVSYLIGRSSLPKH